MFKKHLTTNIHSCILVLQTNVRDRRTGDSNPENIIKLKLQSGYKRRSGMNNRKHIRVKSKFRFTLFVAIMIITAVAGFNSIFGLYTASSEPEHEFVTVEVMPGETLWEIASEHMPSDMDTRKAVHMIQEENDLDDASIKPGQHIRVPV